MIEDVTKRSLDDVKGAYKKYLNEQNLSKNTIMTSSTDAFYIWRKQGADSFWKIVFSDSFEALGKEALLELLRQQSSGNVESNVSGYMAHLRRFRRFIQSEAALEIRQEEIARIGCAEIFFDMLSKDGYTVYFHKQLNNKKMVQIVNEVLAQG